VTAGTVLDGPADRPQGDVLALDVPQGAETRRGRSTRTTPLDRMRQVGLAILGLQLLGLLVWSTVLANRYALTGDFAIYHQAWWLIGHGDLYPFDTLTGYPFFTSHGELLLWALAPVGVLWPHAVTLLWVQDAAFVGAEAVAFTWLCDLAAPGDADRSQGRLPALLASVGLILLVADPWTYWAMSFDFHLELVGMLFVLLAARTLYRDPGGRMLWLWAALALACGDVVATYLFVIGLSGALAGPCWRRPGLRLAAVALGWTLLLALTGSDRGSGLAGGYSYLATGSGSPTAFGPIALATGMVGHPARAAHVLWDRRVDLYAAVAPGGLIGLLSPWVAVAAVVVLLENGLNHYLGFIAPSFQDSLLYVVVPVGTIDVLARLARRRPRWAAAGAALVMVNVLVWGMMWIPRTAGQWLRVSPGAATVLSSVERHIPVNDEVVASQGVVGRFSGRRVVYAITGHASVPVRSATVWVIVAPSAGVETSSVPVSDALIAELAGTLHANLVTHSGGVWVFRWSPAPGTRFLKVPAYVPTVAAWSFPGSAGATSTLGPAADWRAVATGRPGYVVSGDYWRVTQGHYEATAELSSSVPVSVEVWNATSDVLLARREMPASNGFVAVILPVEVTHLLPQPLFTGVGPFSIQPLAAPRGNSLELRVWTSGGGIVSVSALELVPMPPVGT